MTVSDSGRAADVGPTRNGSTTQEMLLATAAKLFREQGYASTTTRQLGRTLGIKSGTLYYYIENKEQLLLSVCIASMQRIADAVDTAIAGVEDPLQRLRCAVHAHVRAALDDADMHAAMLIEMRALSPELRQAVVARREEHEVRLGELISAAQRAGALRADVEVKLLNLALLNLLNWSIFWFHPQGELTADELANTLLTIYFNGTLAGVP